MPSRSEPLTPALLRDWGLPKTGGSKYSRGQVLVVGGARSTPGGAQLAALAALRAGAGRLSLAVAESVAVPLAVAIPESGVTALAETPSGSVRGDSAGVLADSLKSTDGLLVGPGLDDSEQTAALVDRLAKHLGDSTQVVLDAYAVGALATVASADMLSGRLVMTPNPGEAGHLLETEVGTRPGEIAEAALDIARRYGAVVTCQGVVADPEGTVWEAATGHTGLATSGSGDVLAGVVTGLVARGATPAQAACWGTHLHAAAGDRLAARIGPTGFLARELLDELPLVLTELTTPTG